MVVVRDRQADFVQRRRPGQPLDLLLAGLRIERVVQLARDAADLLRLRPIDVETLLQAAPRWHRAVAVLAPPSRSYSSPSRSPPRAGTSSVMPSVSNTAASTAMPPGSTAPAPA